MATLQAALGLMSHLDEAARRRLLAAGSVVQFSAGQTIHQRGDAERSLSVVLEGEVSFHRYDAEGRVVTAGTVGPGVSFGEIPLLTGGARTHDATALTPVRLLSLSHAQFTALLAAHPALHLPMLTALAGMLGEALDSLDSVQRLSVPQRVVRLLLARAAGPDDRQVLAVRQGEIAAALNVSRESVAVALRELRARGLVETGYRAITLTSVEALRRSATGVLD